MVVDDHQRGRVDPGVGEEPAGAPRVLAADGVRAGERGDGTGREVVQVADGRAHQDEAALRR